MFANCKYGVLSKAFKYIALGSYALISLYPLIWLALFSLKNNDDIYSNPFGLPRVFRFENYSNAWKSFNMLLYIKNSTIITIITVFLTILISLMFSYATARIKWKLATPARLYVSIGMFIPVQVILIPIVIIIRDLHLSNSYLSVIIPYTAFQLGFCTIVFYGFLRSLPYELEEAAKIDGANIYTTFFSIILPVVKPAIASMSIFIGLFAWNEFTTALIVITKEELKTLPLGLITFKGQFGTDWGGMGASLVIASIPTIILYILFSEQVENALTVGSAVKG